MTATSVEERTVEAPSATAPAARVNAMHHLRVLLPLLAVTAVVYSWNLTSSGYSDYYSTAAKSMSQSWKAFFFGAFDPNATITLDKLSGFLIPQALSARLFGFSPFSLALPEVLEGLVAVAAAYYLFHRWGGRLGAFVGAAVFAFAPLMVSMFSHGMEDAMLTMFTTLAVAAWQRSIDTRRAGYLILAGVFIGLGFQAKMAQAWLVLPALAALYLWLDRHTVVQRIRSVAVMLLAALAVSLSWMTAMALVPAGQRPYVDGTTNDNVFSMVLGYNGVNRFLTNAVPGALPGDPLFHPVGNAAVVGSVPGFIGHTPVKFLLPQYASQIGWFLPLAVTGLVLGLLLALRPRLGALDAGMRGGVLMSAALLVTVGGVLSVMSLPHTAYLSALMLPFAGLAAIGAVLLARFYRSPSRLRFALPLVVAVETVWCLVQVSSFPEFAVWLVVPVALLGGGGAIALAVYATGRRPGRRIVAATVAVAIAGSALIPVVWAASTLAPAYDGTANDAYGGPQVAAVAARKLKRHAPYGIGLDSNRGVRPTEPMESALYSYVAARSDGRYALATDTWRSAAPLILRGRTRILPIGGFTSRVPSPSPARIRALVASGDLRFVLETPPAAKTGVYAPNLSAITAWVSRTCRFVPPADYVSGDPSASMPSPREQLYDCAPAR